MDLDERGPIGMGVENGEGYGGLLLNDTDNEKDMVKAQCVNI